jgi:acylphosphatase
MPEARIHLHISGRVQGVSYRRFAVREARSLGLTGWVRNLPDRGVELVAEGDEASVEELISRCWEGPSLAIVRGIEVEREPPTGDLDSFRIRY